MKWSEECKQEVREIILGGIAFGVLGVISLAAAVVLFFVETKIHWAVAAILSVIFLAAAGWAFFVEYPIDKDRQRCALEEEAKEEAGRQRKHTSGS